MCILDRNIPDTGDWQNWTTITSSTFDLVVGLYTLRIDFIDSGVNLNWFELQPPITEIFVEAEDYDDESGISLEDTTDDGGGQNIGYIDEGDWVEIETLKPNGMRSGAGSISVTAVDWNKDGYDDLIASSVEGSVLKTQPFYNTGNELLAGKGEKLSLPGLDGLIPISISTLDWNKDGYTDVVLPFQNGDLISMTLYGDMIDIQKMEIDGGPLSNLSLIHISEPTSLLSSGDCVLWL